MEIVLCLGHTEVAPWRFVLEYVCIHISMNLCCMYCMFSGVCVCVNVNIRQKKKKKYFRRTSNRICSVVVLRVWNYLRFPFSPRKPSGHLMMILPPILANIISFPLFSGMSRLTGQLNSGCCLPISSCMLSSASRHCSQGRLFQFVPGVCARPWKWVSSRRT